ncbi:MAG: 4Fe-4S binding protein [Actinomycetota bacterium]|nr:4Fe-4S binding protein [Actinomycetota bacterium]
MYMIDESNCNGCGTCVKACSRQAISILGGVASIDRNRCDYCGSCFAVCPQGAIYQEETAVAVAAGTSPSRVTVSPVKPIRSSPRWLTTLVGLAPVALDLVSEIVRARSYGRDSYVSRRSGASSQASSPVSSARSFQRHRWRGGR